MKTIETIKAVYAGSMRHIIRVLCPSLSLTRSESLNAIKALNEKLHEARKNAEEWRARALSAEGLVTYKLPAAFKACAREHDEQFGTGLSYRL